MGRQERDRTEPPDVEIGAVVKARSLRFKSVPDVDVTLHGDGHGQGSGSERENLPDQVVPGETYHDVTVRWYAASSLRTRV